jgi:hypothetical protein
VSPTRKSGRKTKAEHAERDGRYGQLTQRSQRFWPPASFPLAEYDEKRKSGEVLEEQDSQRDAAVLTADIALVGQLLERDGGR